MAENQDPQLKPPEGTPSSEAGDKLIFGKYKSMEEAEKALKEGETKYHEGQQTLAETKRQLETERERFKEIEGKQEEIRKAKTEEEKKRLEEDLEKMGKEFYEEAKKGPGAFMKGLYRLIDGHPRFSNVVTRDELKRETEADKQGREVFQKVRSLHKEDFDELAPKMAEIWAGLAPESKMKPSEKLLETVYKAAKAENLPDEAKLREKIIADMRAGHTEGGGEKLPPAEKKSDVDEIIEEHKKTKVVLSE